MIFLSEGGSMRSLSGKVLCCWVFLLICYLPLVWTTGRIRSKKRLGSWKDHEATALWGVYKAFPIELEVMAVHWTACTSRVFTLLGLHEETQSSNKEKKSKKNGKGKKWDVKSAFQLKKDFSVLILTEAWEKMRIWLQKHIILKTQHTKHISTHFYTSV